ncbi:SusC/RagA family TonB-linked outer membrane protein [Niabella ginsenosidivorans]|uniref:SusC/RagA family TonB-linked outer membrane protein n=1 Tax=Niabella ginsenosidivorans TaxID=1176587 RepID=UPI000B33C557|nr:SusC/RagA family TonB-linked outer membrane protein [Niabella ginsenosidivorans]
MKQLIPAAAVLLLLLVLPEAFTAAQSRIVVNGRVTDYEGKQLGGVSVTVKGSSSGTITDSTGSFSIAVPNRETVLVFSFIGYTDQELRATGGFLTVRLDPLENALNEVVVVGYGTQRKVSLTSAVSQISGEDLTRRPVTSLEQSLQGQLPGLTILDKGGQPGNNNTPIVLRGVNTLYSSEDLSGAAVAPLVLVDGIEQPFSNINPADIESVSVLKDASSTAIYGSRASNGVILITTKRAKSGKVVVNYSGYYAVQKSVSNPEPLDLESYLKLENLAYKNVGSNPPKPYRDEDIDAYVQGHAADPIHYPLPYDWYNYAFHTAPQINNTLSVSGGNEKFRGRMSLRYLDQGGIIDNTHSNVTEMRVNTDFAVSPKITVSADLDYRYEKNLNPYGLANIFQFMTQNGIWAVPQYPNGDYGGGTQGNNPLLLIEKGGITGRPQTIL